MSNHLPLLLYRQSLCPVDPGTATDPESIRRRARRGG